MSELASGSTSIVLRPMSRAAADALLAQRPPPDVRVAPDHPTEFSAGIAANVGNGSLLGPYFLHRAQDDVVIGEIGGGLIDTGVVEIGYAVVPSCRGLGYATHAVRELIRVVRRLPGVVLVIGHTPLDRPASGRVLEKAGFNPAGVVDDEHDGVPVRVRRWELPITTLTHPR